MDVRVAVSPDDRFLAAVTEHGLLFADLAAGKLIARVGTLTQSAVSGRPVFSPDSRHLAVSQTASAIGAGRGLALLDPTTGRETVRVGLLDANAVLAFSTDGALLATAVDKRLILRDGATLAVIAEMTGEVGLQDCGAFSPDGRLLAVGGRGGKLRLCDLRRGEEIVALDLAAGAIQKIVFTPDGRKVRFVAEKHVGEVDLHAYERHVTRNLIWNLQRVLPVLDPAEVGHVLERLRTEDPAAYRAGTAALESKSTGKRPPP
jgi:WD40 repeat protein